MNLYFSPRSFHTLTTSLSSGQTIAKINRLWHEHEVWYVELLPSPVVLFFLDVVQGILHTSVSCRLYHDSRKREPTAASNQGIAPQLYSFRIVVTPSWMTLSSTLGTGFYQAVCPNKLDHSPLAPNSAHPTCVGSTVMRQCWRRHLIFLDSLTRRLKYDVDSLGFLPQVHHLLLQDGSHDERFEIFVSLFHGHLFPLRLRE